MLLIYLRVESEFTMFLKWWRVIYQNPQFGMLQFKLLAAPKIQTFWEHGKLTDTAIMWASDRS